MRPDRTLTEPEKESARSEEARLEARRRFAAALDRLAERVTAGDWFPAGRDRRFERTGWVMLRAAVAMITRGDEARRKADDWSARGYPSGTGGAHGGGPRWQFKDVDGIVVDEVPVTAVEAASLRVDEWEQTALRLDHERRHLDDDSAAIEARIWRTVSVRPNEGRRSTIVDCVNCGEPALPRPKSGRCNRCYMHRYRHGVDRKTSAA